MWFNKSALLSTYKGDDNSVDITPLSAVFHSFSLRLDLNTKFGTKMAPSAMPMFEEIQNKTNSRQAFGADVDRAIEEISRTLHEAIKRVHPPPRNTNET